MGIYELHFVYADTYILHILTHQIIYVYGHIYTDTFDYTRTESKLFPLHVVYTDTYIRTGYVKKSKLSPLLADIGGLGDVTLRC